MNHKRHHLKTLDVEGHQIEEAVQAICHTVLFQRSTGKYTYQPKGKYTVGTVGIEDVDCDCIDVTYVRIPSVDLRTKLHRDIRNFCDAVRMREGQEELGEPVTAEVYLQFYQRNKTTWSEEHVPWEDWVISINLVSGDSEHARQMQSDRLTADINEVVLDIIHTADDVDLYTPKEPKKDDIDSVYETSFSDIQPYLFKVLYKLNDGKAESQGFVGATVKRLTQVLS